ncbi:MAG: hypothetical protein AB3N14_09530 [Flavobacteriaceae bacterium]
MELVNQLYQGDESAVDNFIDSLFDTNPQDALSYVKDVHSAISNAEPNEHKDSLLVLLESFWNFFNAQISILEKADFVNGSQQLQLANAGFEQLNLIDLTGLTAGFQLYFAAIIDIQAMNLNAGLEKIQQAKEHFESIDKYGKIYNKHIEVMESESLFVSGMNLISQLDYENAEIAIEKASNASKNIAIKYNEEDSDEYHYFMGLGYMYTSLMSFILQTIKLKGFDFDYFDYADNEAYDSSLKALEHLANAIEDSEIARRNLNMAKGVNLLSQVVFELGKCMQALLIGKEEKIVFETSDLRRKIKNANKFFRSIAEQGVIFIRFGVEIESSLINVDKFLKYGTKSAVKPAKKKDVDVTDKIKKLISNGDNKKALDLLIKVYEGYDKYDTIVALKARHSRINKAKIQGRYTKEEFGVQQSEISNDILSLLKIA